MEEIKAWKIDNKIFDNQDEAQNYDFEQKLKKFFDKCFEDEDTLDWQLTINRIKENKNNLIDLLK